MQVVQCRTHACWLLCVLSMDWTLGVCRSGAAMRIHRVRGHWRAGHMKLPDADDQESIPLP